MSNASEYDHHTQIVDESQTFGIIFALGFMVFFLFAFIASMLGIIWRNYLPGADSAKGLIAGVNAAVYTFMSHIT